VLRDHRFVEKNTSRAGWFEIMRWCLLYS